LDLAGAEVVAVVTQPDRARGRSGKLLATPVKELAVEAGVPVILQPEKVRRETTEELRALSPDVGVVAASGHILPNRLLEMFPHGVVNVHASLLPRHRGASAVAASILDGDAESGATIMRVVREVDAGPILGQVRTPIGALDTTETLTERISELGADLLADMLPRWLAGEIEAVEQPGGQTYAQRLSKKSGVIDWSYSAERIARKVRASQPWPLATTEYQGELFVVHEAWPLPDVSAQAWSGWVVEGDGTELSELLPGRVARVVVMCGSGGLALLRVQRAGKRAQDIEVYLNGNPELIGSRLGEGFINRRGRDRNWRYHLDDRRSRHASGSGDQHRHSRTRPSEHGRDVKECIVFRRDCPAYWYSWPFVGPDTPVRSAAVYVAQWNRPYYPGSFSEI
jgi:methionyl-tRNA formyltransferase